MVTPLRFSRFLVLVMLLLCSALTTLTAQSALEEGMKLLNYNKPAEARPLLETALLSDPDNDNIYLLLGLAYEMLGDYEKAITVLQRGLGVSREQKHAFYNNLGNMYMHKMEFTIAEQMFSKAISVKSNYPPPYLNRANARVRLKKYADALPDYEHYLVLNPFTGQRAEIERMIDALRKYLKSEQDKIQAEKDKDKQLVDEVMNSLQNATEGTKDLTVGSDDVLKSDKDEVDIDE